jgi:hypothetical protein
LGRRSLDFLRHKNNKNQPDALAKEQIFTKGHQKSLSANKIMCFQATVSAEFE